MKIIGHRGARGLALENTLESIRTAKKLGVDAIEFDIRLTADKQLVLSHDPRLKKRVSQHAHTISKLASHDLPNVVLLNGEPIPTLAAAMKAVGNSPVFIEAKASGWAVPLAKFLRNIKADPAKTTVIARDYEELATFQTLMPEIPIYVIQKFNPIDVFQTLQVARYYKFTGIDLNFWLLNPLTYWLAKRYKLDVVVYTVNYRWLARFLRRLFPAISITTDYPPRMQFLRSSVQ